MKGTYFLVPLAGLGLAGLWAPTDSALAMPKPETYWQVDDVRAGMKDGKATNVRVGGYVVEVMRGRFTV